MKVLNIIIDMTFIIKEVSDFINKKVANIIIIKVHINYLDIKVLIVIVIIIMEEVSI